MLNNRMFHVAGLAGLDRLRTAEKISSEAQGLSAKCEMQHNAVNDFPGDSPIASRVDRAPTLILEQDGICELVLERGVRHAPILHRFVQVEADNRTQGRVLEGCVSCHFHEHMGTGDDGGPIVIVGQLAGPDSSI